MTINGPVAGDDVDGDLTTRGLPVPVDLGGGPSWAYWHGPGRAGGQDQNRAGIWSQALDDHVARLPGPAEAHDALVAAFGGASAVPVGCRLVRLS